MSFLKPLIQMFLPKEQSVPIPSQEELQQMGPGEMEITLKMQQDSRPYRINADPDTEMVLHVSYELVTGDVWTRETPTEQIKRCPSCGNIVMRKSIHRCIRCKKLCCEWGRCAPTRIHRKCRILQALFGL